MEPNKQLGKMKHVLLLWGVLIQVFLLSAQDKIPALDKSPLDVAYYPANVPFRNFQKGEERNINPKARILYSRPQKKGRTIFGDLVPYGELWRLGANEATELELFTNATVGSVKLNAGRYSLFAKVEQNQWTIMISKDLYIWGHYNLDQSKIIGQFVVPVKRLDEAQDAFTTYFSDDSNGGVILNFMWEYLKIELPIIFANGAGDNR